MSPRLTPAETARREDWVRYLAKQGYNKRQISDKLRGAGAASQSSVGNVAALLGLNVSRVPDPSLPMDPVDWRNDPVPGARDSRLSKDAIITESLAFLDFLEAKEPLFQLATLAEEGELSPEQYGRMARLRDYLDDMCKALRDPRFRAEIRKDPLKYRGRP